MIDMLSIPGVYSGLSGEHFRKLNGCYVIISEGMNAYSGFLEVSPYGNFFRVCSDFVKDMNCGWRKLESLESDYRTIEVISGPEDASDTQAELDRTLKALREDVLNDK